MRTIKFRYLWDKVWHYIVLNNDDVNLREVFDLYEVRPKTSRFYEWTGLKDKNGKEIYEGDICKVDTSQATPSWGVDNVAIVAVDWWNGQFVFNAHRYDFLENPDDYINFGWWVRSNEQKNELKQVEVIGNIHENPDLI